MNRLVLSLSSAAAGALLTYWLDPVSGRRRRALMADRAAHAAGAGRRFARLAARDARHRTIGLAAEARSMWNASSADDPMLAARVRSQLGRLVSHPHALEVEASEGCVTLSGPILGHEADAALRCARQVSGVTAVLDRLSRHDAAGRIPALQGGIARPGPSRWEFAQQSWAPSARLLAGAGGLALAAAALLRRDRWMALLGLGGVALLARSVTNVELPHVLRAGGRGVKVEKSIRIAAPVERVFAFWRDVQNFPRFMKHVHQVTGDLAGTTHWRVDGAAGPMLEWTAQCTGWVDNQHIAWSTQPDSALHHAGSVSFEDCGDGSTRVHVELNYQPPGGAVGHRLARLIGVDPKHQLDDDLMRVKSFLETGHAAHDAAANRRAPASPHRAGV